MRYGPAGDGEKREETRRDGAGSSGPCRVAGQSV